MTILPPYEAPYKPVPQVTPFTYRDGVTMLEKLKGMTRYINRTLVPFVNDNYSDLADAFETQANALIEAVNAAIDLVINSGVEIQDPVVAEIFELADSATRQVVDLLYAPASLTGTVTGINTRVTNLETAVGVINTSIAGINSSITLLNTNLRKFVARSVKDFGATGDGVTDDTSALVAALASGAPLYWGGPNDVYIVSARLVHNLAANMVWRSDGATIKVMPTATHLQHVVSIYSNGFNVYVDGPLTVDANNKSNTAWSIRNETTTFAKCTLIGVNARNCFRQDQTYTGGDGIYIRGAFTTVFLQQPDVRNVVMASGAGVSGVQGVSGISVVSHGAGMAPSEITIESPYISNVYSQDLAYLMDQDGIRIFTEEDTGTVNPFSTHFNIRGGKIINCGGRAIKLQTEFGLIDGTFIARQSSAPWGTRKGAMPEIDFQTSAGIIRNVELQYVSNTPSRVINWNGTRQVGGKHTTGILVSGIKLTYSGSQVLDRFMAATSDQQATSIVTVENIEIVNYVNRIQEYFLTVSGTDTSQLIIARLHNINVPILTGQYVCYRVGAATPLNVSFHNVANISPGAGTAVLMGSTTAGAVTQVSSGNNIKVV